ncbi:MAG: DUF4846 domain-containing protein [Flavobacteriales bacterium]
MLPLKSNLSVLFIISIIACSSEAVDYNSNIQYLSADGQAEFIQFEADSVMLKLPWLEHYKAENSLINRISSPDGYKRIVLADSTFGWWLRRLPLLEGKPDVLLYNGQKKGYQGAHYTILDIDVGKKDLQQCADAVMRLRAEYLRWHNKEDMISFNYTSGDKIKYSEWKKGGRPVVRGNKVTWAYNNSFDASYQNFRKYLDNVFMYAGSLSLSKELKNVDFANILPGDVFIQGGSPGHAVIVMDVAVNTKGEKVFMLAQSYMPAQQIHILANPNKSNTCWYTYLECRQLIETPEWMFAPTDLKQF